MIGRIARLVGVWLATSRRARPASARRPLRGPSGDEAPAVRPFRCSGAARERVGDPGQAAEAAQPLGQGATKDTPDAPTDDDSVADAARRIGVDRMSQGALIAFLAEHRRTDPSGAEAAMRALSGAAGRAGWTDAAACNGVRWTVP